MSIELKIKSKHLALEPNIIKTEEHKLLQQIKWWRGRQETKKAQALYFQYISLYMHRVNDVRNASRATFLARAYLAGQAYRTVENKRKVENEYTFQHKVAKEAVRMINNYSPFVDGKRKIIDKEEFLAWAML